jgi:hypothetical protein
MRARTIATTSRLRVVGLTLAASLAAVGQSDVVSAAGGNLTMIVRGDRQTVPVTPDADGKIAAQFSGLMVRVVDTSGRGVPALRVTFSCAAPKGLNCTYGTDDDSDGSVLTDGQGIARAPVIVIRGGVPKKPSFTIFVQGDDIIPAAFTESLEIDV